MMFSLRICALLPLSSQFQKERFQRAPDRVDADNLSAQMPHTLDRLTLGTGWNAKSDETISRDGAGEIVSTDTTGHNFGLFACLQESRRASQSHQPAMVKYGYAIADQFDLRQQV